MTNVESVYYTELMKVSLFPTRAKEYIWYFLVYWVLFWALSVLFSIGVHVIKYGHSGHVSVDRSISNIFFDNGKNTLLFMTLFGTVSWRNKYKREKNEPSILEILEKSQAEKRINQSRAKYLFRLYKFGIIKNEQDIKKWINRH